MFIELLIKISMCVSLWKFYVVGTFSKLLHSFFPLWGVLFIVASLSWFDNPFLSVAGLPGALQAEPHYWLCLMICSQGECFPLSLPFYSLSSWLVGLLSFWDSLWFHYVHLKKDFSSRIYSPVGKPLFQHVGPWVLLPSTTKVKLNKPYGHLCLSGGLVNLSVPHVS